MHVDLILETSIATIKPTGKRKTGLFNFGWWDLKYRKGIPLPKAWNTVVRRKFYESQLEITSLG